MAHPMHLLPPKMKCPAQLRPYILCILGALPTGQPPFTPNPNLKIQSSNSHIVMIGSPKKPLQESQKIK